MAKRMRAPLGKLVGRVNLILMALVMLTTSTGYITSQSASATGLEWGEAQVSQVDGGSYLTCGVTDDHPFCWGQNTNGQIGNGTTADSPTPAAVSTSGVLSGKIVTKVVAGGQFACALAQGAVYCWGRNNLGQLGNNSTTNSSVPVAVNTGGVLAGKTVTSIAAGAVHACAVADGQAYCWGGNSSGQLGNNSTTDSSVPVAVNTSGVLAGKTVTSMAAGDESTCALAQGAVYCWGRNNLGQLGNNSTTNSSVPVAVDTSGVLAGKTVTGTDAGAYYNCAIAGGQVYCWGRNSSGQLGNNSTTNSSVPVAVSTSGLLSGKVVTTVATGAQSTCVLAQGQIYCWGDNSSGQLGNNSTTNSSVPVAVSTNGALANKTVTSIAAGAYHSCAIADSQAYCWGDNLLGEVGTGTTSLAETTPVAVHVYQPPQITSVTFENDEYGKILVVHGQDLFASGNAAANQALTVGSIASLNNVPIVTCAGGTLLAAFQGVPEVYNPAYYTATPACYFVYNFDATVVMVSPTELRIWVPDNFDITAPGTVSVNSLPAFSFNPAAEDVPGEDAQEPTPTPSIVTPDVPKNTAKVTVPTATETTPVNIEETIATGAVSMTVDGMTLLDSPLISSLPVFKGKAAPNSTVTVTVHSDPVTCTTKADEEGNWECRLAKTLPAGNHTVKIAMTTPDNQTTHLGPYPVYVAAATSDQPSVADPQDASQTAAGLPVWILVSSGVLLVALVAIVVGILRRRTA